MLQGAPAPFNIFTFQNCFWRAHLDSTRLQLFESLRTFGDYFARCPRRALKQLRQEIRADGEQWVQLLRSQRFQLGNAVEPRFDELLRLRRGERLERCVPTDRAVAVRFSHVGLQVLDEYALDARN